jgi:PAS domain S-box-containing protein
MKNNNNHINVSHHIKDEVYRLLVDAALDYAIFLIDKEGKIQTWNRGAERLKGYSASEVIGKSFKIFYTPEDLNRHHPERELEIAGEDGRYEEEGWRIKKDGSRFWANVIITKLVDESGVFIGFSKITRDLTERKNAEEKLKKAEEELRVTNASLEEKVKVRTEDLMKALKAKDQFLSIASHELNTPLTTMKMQNQMRLKKLSKSDSIFDKVTLENIFNNDLKLTNRLVKLVEDFLEFSRINAGKMVLKKETCNLNQLIKETAERFEIRLEQTQIKLDVILPTATLEAVCDSFRIEQVLNNLMTNAIKYGLGNPIVISLERENNLAVIKVLDLGMGIAQQDLDRIFEQFERAISASEISGMGIGLFIAKQIIDAHNGIIRVESEPEKGSTFIVELPLIN